MKIPDVPKVGEYVFKFANACIAWMRANTIMSVNGGRLNRTANGITIFIDQPNETKKTNAATPFRLSAYKSGSDKVCKVSARLSHITNGTNGAKINLLLPSGADWKSGGVKFDDELTLTESSLIVLQAAVDPDTGLALSDWEIIAVPVTTPEDAVEVGIDEDAMSATFGKQIFLRLLIGSVVIVAEPESITTFQAVFSPQMVTFGLFSGVACAVFQPAPIHPDFLTAANY